MSLLLTIYIEISPSSSIENNISDQMKALLGDKVVVDRESGLPQAPFLRAVNRSKSFRTPRQRCGSGSVKQSLASFASGAGKFENNASYWHTTK